MKALTLSILFLATASHAAVTYTVGTGGDFSTLNAALTAISQQRPSYLAGGDNVEIRLLSGFRLSEQIRIERNDLGFVRISSVDPEVVIVRSALTASVYDGDSFPAFSAFENAVLPVIDVLFNMDSSGSADKRTCFYVSHNSRASFKPARGCKNAGYRGLEVHNGSSVNARETIFANAGSIGIRVANGAWAAARDADVSGAGEYGIAVDTGSHLDGKGMRLNDCRAIAASVQNGSTANLINAEAHRAGTRALSVRTGAHVAADALQATYAGTEAMYVESASTVDLNGPICQRPD